MLMVVCINVKLMLECKASCGRKQTEEWISLKLLKFNCIARAKTLMYGQKKLKGLSW